MRIITNPNFKLHSPHEGTCGCNQGCGCGAQEVSESGIVLNAKGSFPPPKKSTGVWTKGKSGLRIPELLAPAGSLQHLKMAADYGADAVYAGVPRWSLRVRGNGFTREDFAKGIEYVHSLNKQFFVVFNVIPHVRRSVSFMPALDEVAALKPDAFIMADPGLIDTALNRYPDIPVHLSVQANTVNPGTVKFWQKLGVRRVILARELSLGEIEMIRNECPDMEIEVFIHGALCIAVSGRCLISGMLARRDANVGACNNSCRWNYRIKDLHSERADDPRDSFEIDNDVKLQGAEPISISGSCSSGGSSCGCGSKTNPLDERDFDALSMEIEETSRREGEWMPMEEDEHGSYLMNSKDLCALPVLKRLMEIGVDSLKIEGRSRSPFYAGGIARAYRLAIDALANGEEIPEETSTIINSIPSRGYTTALLEANRPDTTQDYESNAPSPGKWQVVGEIERQENGRIYIKVKNRFTSKNKLIVYTPHGPLKLDGSSMLDEKGNPTDVAPGDRYFVSLAFDTPIDLTTAVLLRDDSED